MRRIPSQREARIPPEVGQEKQDRQHNGVLFGQQGGPEQNEQRQRRLGAETAAAGAVEKYREGGQHEHDAEGFRAAGEIGHGFGLHRMQQKNGGGESGQQIAPGRLRARALQQAPHDRKT